MRVHFPLSPRPNSHGPIPKVPNGTLLEVQFQHLLEKEGRKSLEIRVLPETLALALHGETQIVGRRRSLAKKRRSPSVQGGGPSAARKNHNATRTNPTVQAQALALQGRSRNLVW